MLGKFHILHTLYPKAWKISNRLTFHDSIRGRLIKDRNTKKPKITCRNWECGVIVPARRATVAASSSLSASSHEENKEEGNGNGKGKAQEAMPTSAAEDDTLSWGVFEGHVPVPMKVPASPLQMNGSKSPFFFGGF